MSTLLPNSQKKGGGELNTWLLQLISSLATQKAEIIWSSIHINSQSLRQTTKTHPGRGGKGCEGGSQHETAAALSCRANWHVTPPSPGTPISPPYTHIHTLTHKHTDICPQLQELITNSSVSVWVCVSLFCVCSSFHLYLGGVEIIDDTLIRNNLLLMLLACDCHHQTHCTWLLLEQSGSVCSVQARDTHIKKGSDEKHNNNVINY